MTRDGPLRIKLQLFAGAEPALGPGRADVLEAIDETGSISGAGRRLGMSYRRAWLLVDSMNRCFTGRLVETAMGGAARGGARLTEDGRTVLDAYRALEAELARSSKCAALADIEQRLRADPGAAG